MRAPIPLLLYLLPLAYMGACAGAPEPSRAEIGDPSSPPSLAPPLLLGEEPAAEAGLRLKLEEPRAIELPGLHHLFRLSERILSGSEPEDAAALARLAEMGVRTVISVDGKIPDAQAAAEVGLRYVHIPIHYSGIGGEELLALVKTFRELPAPFYVHCFHGKHRGPTAAAIGRLVLDGITREQALAEMRQWCATSPDYEGLYRTVAEAELPSEAESRACTFDFESAHAFEGTRAAMIELARVWERLRRGRRLHWAADPEHPDVDLLHEAERVRELFGGLSDLPDAPMGARSFGAEEEREDFRGLAEAARAAADLLVGALEGGEGREQAFEGVRRSCADCHHSYRDR